MEESTILFSLLSFIFVLLFCFKFLMIKPKISHKLNLPPSPPSIPFLGHLHLKKLPLHRFYHSLSLKYGPVFSLRFGSRRVVVVSSSTAAEECFTKNDIILANRPTLLITKHLSYGRTTMVAAPYGEYWRNLRRIGAIDIFSSKRLNMFQNIRKDEVDRFLKKLWSDSREGFTRVELKSMLTGLALNNITRMTSGKRPYDGGLENEREGKEFRDVIEEVFGVGGVSHPADFFPKLSWMIGRNYERKLKGIHERMDRLLQKLIDDTQGWTGEEEAGTTMIHHLLSLQQAEPMYYTDQVIKGLILVIIFGGTDTVAITLEWAMSNLLNNPHVLKKARAEIDSLVGEQNLLDEADLPNLKYIKNVILETLRLNPPAPVLLSHMASSDCTIQGYDVPRDTIVIVNAWAIHTDPELWDDPMSFKPERFESCEGESNKMMPFGLGRRACPGSGMAHRFLGLTLGLLIQCFEWERVSEEKIDMTEGTGTTTPKKVPLQVMCKARPVANKVFAGTV